ncbi:MAG: deoxyribodipyrimidine photo-lyase [Desulfuromonadales bacterium]|nr:MAG: deoxyribodipyrimidine photo-lyase [Desulfuromonadales bacterium]
MNPDRIRVIGEGAERTGPVVCWMSRDQRTVDNWALLHAQELALARQVPLAVAFCLVPAFLGATIRHYGFMLKGLREVEASLAAKGIPFFLFRGEPAEEIGRFALECGASAVVTDFDPLRIKRQWKAEVVARGICPLVEVDAHNIVPCWIASPKAEFGAYTIRPKIHRLLPRFLEPFPTLQPHPFSWPSAAPAVAWDVVLAGLSVDRSVPEVAWIEPGERAARRALDEFVAERLAAYPERRNDPAAAGQSGLSPHLHFGHLAPQRVALAVLAADVPPEARDAFLEELVVRRELSDNFCLHNPDYDRVAGVPAWARQTLDSHRDDPRPYRYSREALERGETHDPLWNGAQREMVLRGKMHGYLRMYWAKKILEWTGSPEEAMEIAIVLNDRYELDGRDPNGYAGIAWSIGGVHDRAWGERPVFGKVRYMSYGGCARKFDIEAYLRAVDRPVIPRSF